MRRCTGDIRIFIKPVPIWQAVAAGELMPLCSHKILEGGAHTKKKSMRYNDGTEQ